MDVTLRIHCSRRRYAGLYAPVPHRHLDEVGYFRNGGILPYVLRNPMKAV
jgi:hypothetical protein